MWDSDLIPLCRWDLFTPSTSADPIMVPTVAVLQEASKHKNVFNEYVVALRALLGLEVMTPPGGGTFVTHHMRVVIVRAAWRNHPPRAC